MPDLRPKSHFLENSEISSQDDVFPSPIDQKLRAESRNRDSEFEKRLDLELLETFLLGKSKKTKESYQRIALELLSFLGSSPLRNATLGSLKAFLEIKNHQAHESKRLRLAVLKSFFSYAVKIGYLQANVASLP
jgi:hypothetical protein